MRQLFLLAACLALAGCGKPEGCIYAGPVESVYYVDHNAENNRDFVAGITRLDHGGTGMNMSLKQDVWVEIYPDWVIIRIKNRGYSMVLSKEKIQAINIGAGK